MGAILIRVNYRRLSPLCGKVSVRSHDGNGDGNRNRRLGDRMFEGDLDSESLCVSSCDVVSQVQGLVLPHQD